MFLFQAREAATRNRHTRHREHPGELPGGDPHSPWHSEMAEQECSCPPETCVPAAAPQPRLLYSLRESRVVQRALDLSDPRLVKLLTYASSPSSLCPAVLGPPSPGLYPPCGPPTTLVSPTAPGYYPVADYLPQRVPPGLYPFPDQLCPCHTEEGPHNALAAAAAVGPPFPLQTAGPICAHGGATCLASQPPDLARTGGVPVCSGPDCRPPLSTGVEAGPCQPVTAGSESRARSVCQQTDGNPVEEDLDMPSHAAARSHHSAAQHVPGTRAAPSCVTPAQYNSSAPFQSEHPPTHMHGALPCPGQPPHLVQPCSQYHTHTFLYHAPGQAPLQPLAYHPHSHTTVLGTSLHQHVIHQRQPPVVQEPSDSSMSQDSSELSPSQERQRDGPHSTSSGQSTAPPDVVPRDSRPEPLGARCSFPHSSPNPRAIADYAHSDFPWRGPSSLHSYQPTPVYVIGIQAPHPQQLPHPPSWPAHAGGMFLPPSPLSNPQGLFGPPSHPAGLFASSTGMFTSPTPGQLFVSQFHSPYNPFLYPQTVLPDSKPMAFNPNFNLSNSNPHVYVQQAFHHRPSVARFYPESAKLRVVESNHAVGADASGHLAGCAPARASAAAWTTTTEEDALGSDLPALPRTASRLACPSEASASGSAGELAARASGSEVGHASPAPAPSPGPASPDPHIRLTASEVIEVFQADVASAASSPEPVPAFPDEAAPTELADVFPDEAASSELAEALQSEGWAPGATHAAAASASSSSSATAATENFGTQL